MSVARETGALVMVHAGTTTPSDSSPIAPSARQDRAAIPCRLPPIRSNARRPTTRHFIVEIVDVPLLIVHVSNREAMEEIRRAQQRGLKIYGRPARNIWC